MKRNNVYFVKFRDGKTGEEKGIAVLASNKAEAYETAFYYEIPKQFGSLPYSAWVFDVTYQNGNVRYFNTCEGNAY